MGFQFVDAAKCVFFTAGGEFDPDLTDACLSSVLGVIFSYSSSRLMVRPRSLIIVAKAINAEIYENWTDVSGFLAADPHVGTFIVENRKNTP